MLTAVVASTGSTAKTLAINTEVQVEDGNVSLRDEYRKNVSMEIMRSKEQLSEAKSAERRGQLTKAAALYMAVALPLMERQHFKEGRASFDAAFSVAPKLSKENQKELVKMVVLICKKKHRQRTHAELLESFSQPSEEATPRKLNASAEKYVVSKAYEFASHMTEENLQTKAEAREALSRMNIEDKNYKKAESLLIQLLSEVKKRKSKIPNSIMDACLADLAVVYEREGDTALATRYWKQRIKLSYKSHDYVGVFSDYEIFLENQLLHHIYNGNLSKKLFWLEYTSLTRSPQPEVNSSYATTAVQWARLLHNAGDTKCAVAVLKVAIKDSNKLSAEVSNQRLLKTTCAKYLLEQGKIDEADMMSAVDAEISNHLDPKSVLENKKLLAETISNHFMLVSRTWNRDPNILNERLTRMMFLALSSRDPNNVNLVLKQLPTAESDVGRRSDENFTGARRMKLLKAIDDFDPSTKNSKTLSAMYLNIAFAYLEDSDFESANKKWDMALKILQQVPIDVNPIYPTISSRLAKLGATCTDLGKLSEAEKLLLMAYRCSFNEWYSSDKFIVSSIEYLASRYRESNNNAAAESLLKRCIAIATDKESLGIFYSQAFKLKLANFYAQTNLRILEDRAFKEFLASDTSSPDYRDEYITEGIQSHGAALYQSGFKSDANILFEKATELRIETKEIDSSPH